VIKRKKPVKKPSGVKKAATKQKKVPKENIIGTVTHYFPQVRAAVIKLKAPLAIGDTIKIKGHTTDFKQKITSMQIDHVPVETAKKGQEIGLLVESRVRQHDAVTKC
jgi:putative protease